MKKLGNLGNSNLFIGALIVFMVLAWVAFGWALFSIQGKSFTENLPPDCGWEEVLDRYKGNSMMAVVAQAPNGQPITLGRSRFKQEVRKGKVVFDGCAPRLVYDGRKK